MKIRAKISQLRSNKDARALMSNFVWLSVLKVIGYIFPLITLPYLSRVIGVEGFGEIAFASSIIVFIETFADFGFNYTATRDIARIRSDVGTISTIFTNVFWTKILLMIVGFLILCILVYFIPSLYDKRLLLFITFLYIPGHIIFPDWFFQAMEKMKYITILNVLSKAIFTILIFIVIREKDDYLWQPLLTAIGYCISGIISMYYIFKKFQIRIHKPSIYAIKNSIRSSYSMFLSLIIPNLYTNFSTILLRTTCGEVATGIFDAGKRFESIISQISEVLSRTFYPFLARRLDKHHIYTLIQLFFSISGSLFLFFGANFLVDLFYTSEFNSATEVIRIFSVSPIAIFLMNTYGTNYLVLKGKEKIYRNIIIVCAIIGFILTLVLTPRYSYIGASITIVFVWCIRGLMTYCVAKKYSR